MSYYNKTEIFAGCFTTILICTLIGAFGGWVFMLLWNWLAPLFWNAAPQLTLCQALGVLIFISWIASLFRSKSK